MLSICITVKNRSRVNAEGRELRLLPRCVESLAQSIPRGLDCELVVSDWRSDDWPLADWIEAAAQKLPVRVVQLEGEFCRGAGRNQAAATARGESLLFLDADVLACTTLLETGLRYAAEGTAFFPILYSFDDPAHHTGHWRDVGYGNCMLPRSLFELSGGWPEYRYWGQEDDHFFQRVKSVGQVVRQRVEGFYHQWHPDDIAWKDRCVDRSGYVDPEAVRQQRFRDQLERVVPPDTRFLLLDGNYFGDQEFSQRTAVPFPNRDGVYWGEPRDNNDATWELERAGQCDAALLVIAWPAFWWLEYYSQWSDRLRRDYCCLAESDVLIAFDLATPPQTAVMETPDGEEEKVFNHGS
jgi:glycosyltransferase involved in cell wall biosynthesis